jgi:hypothetical protein
MYYADFGHYSAHDRTLLRTHSGHDSAHVSDTTEHTAGHYSLHGSRTISNLYFRVVEKSVGAFIITRHRKISFRVGNWGKSN